MLIDNEVVIVTFAKFQLVMLDLDMCANCLRVAKIEGRACNVAQFTGRNAVRSDRREAIRVHLQLVVQDVSPTGEIEVRMIGKVDDSRLVSSR